MKTSATMIERASLLVFLILTPVLSLAIPAFLSLPPEAVPLILIFIPAVLAILLTALAEGRRGMGVLGWKLAPRWIDFKWYLIAFGLGLGSRLAISLLAILLGWA